LCSISGPHQLEKGRHFRTLAHEELAAYSIHVPSGGMIMEKWICTVCGYVYDPTVGDSTQDINPGVKFEDLPDSWVCPDCGAGKDLFEKA
jgi:rubredoxin